MKKGLIMLVAAMVVFGLLSYACVVCADDVMVGRDVEITGVGTINADIDLRTEPGYVGLGLSERITTPGGGFEELSLMKYESSFELGSYNDNDMINSSSELEYTSTVKVINAKRALYIRNYKIGAIMGMSSEGNTDHETIMYMDDSSSVAEIEGDSEGRLKLSEKVKSLKDTHTDLSYDIIELVGNFTVKWTAYAEYYTYPEGELSGDWLGCP